MPDRDTEAKPASLPKGSGASQISREHVHSVGDSVHCSMHRSETTVVYIVAGLTYLACGCFISDAGGTDEAPGTAGQGCLFDPSEFDVTACSTAGLLMPGDDWIGCGNRSSVNDGDTLPSVALTVPEAASVLREAVKDK